VGQYHPLLEDVENYWFITAFAAISGAVYCFGNVFIGFMAAKNKVEALILF
jgi:hypothetical protein